MNLHDKILLCSQDDVSWFCLSVPRPIPASFASMSLVSSLPAKFGGMSVFLAKSPLLPYSTLKTGDTMKIQLLGNSDERIILSAMLGNERALKYAVDKLKKEDFTEEHNKLIFSAFQTLYSDDKPADTCLLANVLRANGELEGILKAMGREGNNVVLSYLLDLAQADGNSAHIDEYCEILIEKSTCRNITELGKDMVALGKDGIDAAGIVEYSKKSLQHLIKNYESSSEEKRYGYLLEKCSKKDIVEELQNISPGVKAGLKIGDIDLEFPGGAISIIAAPTSHGKTTMLINNALGVLEHNEKTSVYFFSLEESRASIMTCFANTRMGVKVSNNNRKTIDSFLREGTTKYVTSEANAEQFKIDIDSVFTSLTEAGALNVFYADMSAEELCSAIHYLKKKKPGLGAVFIDYMQLLSLKKSQRGSRQEELKEVCIMLKDCAVETGLPIILGAQFSRKVTCEGDISPIFISEAGDIERIASLILGFWNREIEGFTKDGNLDKQENKIPKASKIYAEVLKGRKIGSGHNTVLSFNGNLGILKRKQSKLIDETIALQQKSRYTQEKGDQICK